jgi:pimeloyl-ACP methyl ester carboxylesterase
MSNQSKPSIVFVHGIWADGSSFSKVIPTLQTEGHEVIAAQYGLDTLAGDVAAVKAALARVSSPAILVGHSYGGTLITAAGTDPRVAGLVYIAALAPDADETSQSQQAKFPVTDVFSHIEVSDGRIWMLPEGVASLLVTCLNRSGSLSGQRMRHRPRTCSIRRSKELPGGPNRAGTSSLIKTEPFSPNCNASWRNAWARPLARSTAAMCRCSPARPRDRRDPGRRQSRDIVAARRLIPHPQ